MPYRSQVFARGCYYHIYNRGVARGRLFFGDDNYEHCLHLAKQYAPRYEVAVIAYCLMPNHYHLLLRQDGDQPLSRFINTLFNAYVQAVNRQRRRRGPLFEGRFRHILVDRDEYVLQLCRYIHLNPVKARLVVEPEEWPYSNYRDWIGLRRGTLKDEAFIREFWETPEQYRAFVREGRQDQALDAYLLE